MQRIISKKSKKHYPISDHFNGKTFFNPGFKIIKNVSDVFKLYVGSLEQKKWPRYVYQNVEPRLAKHLELGQTHLTYINHATHLIQLQNLNILTDPVFSKRVSPFSFVGPKRVRDPGMVLKTLPPIHVILISHNHYDHMDMAALRQLEKMHQPLIMVPLGNKHYLKKFANVIEKDWWETVSVGNNQTVSLVPARHWSKRTLRDTNKALWSGFWITSGNLKIYFAGDTGYGPHFKLLKEKMGSPDISLLPIGSYEPRWFMKPQHLNPEEAVLASLDLGSTLSIANHHLTFRLSYEDIDAPARDLKIALKNHGVSENQFLTPENGETVIFPLD